jgi:SPP1 family predicted phage head-tail adaptor
MRAGKLRHSIIVEQRATTKDSVGQQTLTWSTFATVYAAVEPLSGRELIAAQAIQNETTHRVTLRYLAALVSGMRINFGGRYLNILSVRNIEERDREMICECSEGLNNG